LHQILEMLTVDKLAYVTLNTVHYSVLDPVLLSCRRESARRYLSYYKQVHRALEH